MAARSAGTARWGALTRLALAIRSAVRPGSPSLGARLAAVPRMLRATARGEYGGMSWSHVAALLGALAYVVSPIDLVPEGLLAVFGLADDAVILAWMAAALVADTEKFLAWEGRPQDAPTWQSRSTGPAQGADPKQRTVRSHVVG